MKLLARIKAWAQSLRRDVFVLWHAARHPGVPLAAKIVAAGVAAYALSPIDLIPDFIPVLGLLDDVLIVPFGIWWALRLIPPELVLRFRAEFDGNRLPRSNQGAAAIVLIWLAGLGGALIWFMQG